MESEIIPYFSSDCCQCFQCWYFCEHYITPKNIGLSLYYPNRSVVRLAKESINVQQEQECAPYYKSVLFIWSFLCGHFIRVNPKQQRKSSGNMRKDVDVMWKHVCLNVWAFQYLYVYTYILLDVVRYKICVINLCFFVPKKSCTWNSYLYRNTKKKLIFRWP